MNELPYVGLRPFKRGEHEIFFGRKDSIKELFELLDTTNFLAVTGESSCGKSSLVCCGLEGKLLQENESDSIIHWHIADFYPSAEPFFQLTDSLLDPKALGGFFEENFENQLIARQYLRQTLAQSNLSLHSMLDQKPLPENHKLLLVCDEFDRIFHLWKTDKDVAEKLVHFLISCSEPSPFRENSQDIYVIITLRSDYLDEIPLFPKLEGLIRDNLFLVPRLREEQIKDIITEPISYMNDALKEEEEPSENEEEDTDDNAYDPIEEMERLYITLTNNVPVIEEEEPDNDVAQYPTHVIAPELIDKLIAIVEDSGEQLSLVQHLLRRMWVLDHIGETRDFTEDFYKRPRITDPVTCLTQHLEGLYYGLEESQIPIAEILFRKLMDFKDGCDSNLLYCPVKLKDIVDLIEIPLEKIIEVVDIFRSPSACFLSPPSGVTLTGKSLIEIPHESIVRHWQRLKDWKAQEAKIKKNYKEINSLALDHIENDSPLLKQPELGELWTWHREAVFTEIWAKHYDCEFLKMKNFLDKSKFQDSTRKTLAIVVFGVLFIGVGVVLFKINEKEVQKDAMVSMLKTMKEDLINEKNSPKLEEKLKIIVEKDPSNFDGWFYYGIALDYQNKWTKAEDAFRHAHELEPNNSDVTLRYSKLLLQKNQYQQVFDLLTEANKNQPKDVEVLNKLGDVLVHLSRFNKPQMEKNNQVKAAIDIYKKSLELKPSDDKILMKIGRSLSLLGNKKEALEYLRKAVAINSNSAENWSILGEELMAQGEINEAISAFSKLVGINPSDEKNWRTLGLAFFTRNNFEEATDAFERAVTLNKDSDENYRNLGNALMARNQLKLALRAYNIAQGIKVSRETLLQKAKLLEKQNRVEESRALYKKALTIRESNWE